MTNKIRLGELFTEAGLITQEQLEEALEGQRTSGRKLGAELIARGLVGEFEFAQILSNQLSIPWVSLKKIPFTRDLLSLIPAEVAERYNLVPVYVRTSRGKADTLFVALDDPMNQEALSAIAEITGMRVKPMIVPPSEIRDAIRVYYFGLPPKYETSSGELEAVVLSGDRDSTPGAEPPSASSQTSEKSAENPAAAPVNEETRAVEASQPVQHTEAQAKSPPPRELEIIEDDADELEDALTQSRDEAEEAAASVRKTSEPQGEAKEKPRFITMTLLDGTQVRLPAASKKGAIADTPADQGLTARDLVKALKARADGRDTQDILGDASWETLFATMLSILLRKGLVADWEFVEEWQKQSRKKGE